MIGTFTKIVAFALLGHVTANDVSPFPIYRIKEVKFEGGVAAATSDHGTSWLPARAFMKQMKIDNGWHAGQASGVSQTLPQSIWYDFKTISVRPAELSFMPAQSNANAMQGAPSAYQFIGSNDKVCDGDATWTVLCEDISDTAWRNYWEVRYCKVKPENSEKFRCLGIRAMKNRRTDGWTSIRNIRMWELIQDQETQKQEL